VRSRNPKKRSKGRKNNGARGASKREKLLTILENIGNKEAFKAKKKRPGGGKKKINAVQDEKSALPREMRGRNPGEEKLYLYGH